MRRSQISSLVRYLPIILVLVTACEAPPTREQVTSRAVKRNCEAQGAAAANESRKQNIQVLKEGSAVNQEENERIESKAAEAQRTAFKSCMLKFAV